MHIAFLTPEYPHPELTHSGGLGTSIRNIADALVQMNLQVSVLVYGQEEEKIILERGIQIYSIPQRNYLFGGWFWYRKYLERRINKLIKETKIDLVEAPDWTGITAFVKLKCPLVIRLNGSDGYFCHLEKRKQKLKNRIFEKSALSSADAIISVSEFTGRTTMQIFGLNKNFKVIPNSVYMDRYKKVSSYSNSNTILYFGTVIRKKGLLELAEIFNRINEDKPDVEFRIAGRDVIDSQSSSSTFELFKNRLNSSAIEQLKYLGQIAHEDVQNEIAKADVVLLPSFAEALPMTWLETMAMGKALISSDIGWAKEVMEDGKTGYTVNPRNHTEFARKAIDLLNHKDLRARLGKNARKRVEESFSSERIALRNYEFYKEVISTSQMP